VSDNLPPSSPPPSGPPPSGPPPAGPPPSGPPPAGPPPGAEYLEQGGGGPLPPQQPGSRNGRKKALIAGGSLLGLAVVAGGAFGAYWYLSSGPQPAEALPDSTVAYASIDLDPSGAQKIEALRTLKKFPAIDDQLDLNTDDDIRQRLFEEIEKGLDCPDLDYGDDIEPWLGDRAAVAAVDLGDDSPTPVVVLQVKDADQAEAGLTAIKDCAGATGGDGSGGWSINGDWAVIAESDDIAEQVASDAEDASLADDDTYQKWTDEAGGQGIVTLYAAPAAGTYLADAIGGLASPFGLMGGSSECSGSADSDGNVYESCSPESTDGLIPDEVRGQLEDFKGAAASIRFDDGSLELELASDSALSESDTYAEGKADDVLATLPDDTAAAIGVGFADGWVSDVLDRLDSYSGGSGSDDLVSQIEAETGLDLPDDAETLAGESLSLSFGSDFDPEVLVNSTDGSGVPIGVKVKGDADAIKAVLAKVQATFSDPAEGTFLDADSDGDLVAIGPDDDYRGQLLDDGDLGGSDVFRDVVPDAERADAILFVNFDAGDWLVNLASGDQEAEDNLSPLSGAGISSRTEDDVTHTVLRITTN
jgi:hypothetical protein